MRRSLVKVSWNLGLVPISCALACLEQLPAYGMLAWLSTCVFVASAFGIATYRRWNWLDLGVSAIVGGSLVSYVTSLYPTNGIPAVCTIVEASLVYFLIRGIGSRFIMPLLLWICVVGSIIDVRCIATFGIHYATWTSYHFLNLIDFRRQITLFSGASYSGVQSFLFLLFIPFAIVGLKNSSNLTVRFIYAFTFWMSLLCAVMTFRRIIYLAAIPLLVVSTALLLRKPSSMQLVRLLKSVHLYMCLVVLAVIASFWRPILTTILISNTVSQARSVTGRIDAVQEAGQLFRSHAWTGVGIGNFAHANRGNTAKYTDDYIPETFNWYTELAAEQGLIGLIFYTGAFVAFWAQWSRLRASDKVIYAAAFISMATFALGEASWTDSRSVYDLTAMGLAVMTTREVLPA
jgi:O-antigen ligase